MLLNVLLCEIIHHTFNEMVIWNMSEFTMDVIYTTFPQYLLRTCAKYYEIIIPLNIASDFMSPYPSLILSPLSECLI